MSDYSSDFTRRDWIKTSAVASAALAGAGSGLITNPSTARAEKPVWTSLFDGKTLKGWHKNPKRIGHGTGGQWAVEDGTITGQQDPPGSGNGGILLTDNTYDNFDVMIDMKPDWGVCSGFFLRGNARGQCVQMMVDYHDRGNVGHLYGEGTGGWNTRAFDIDGVYENKDGKKQLVKLKTSKHKSAKDVGLVYSCTPAQWLQAWKLNDWNTARVKVEGKYAYVTTWINGVKICEFDGAKSTAGRYNKEKVDKTLGGKGSIAVQVHGGKGWPKGAKCRWKNVQIRSL